MTYRLGVDVGGTFTDLLLFNEQTGDFWRHKTPSTPHDSSEDILIGVESICAQAEILPADIEVFLHGTTVATNAVLEGKGARVGLIVTEGYRQIMQIARSFVPGGLAGWIVWPKPQPLAALEDTVEIKGRMTAQGAELRPIDEANIRSQLEVLKAQGVDPWHWALRHNAEGIFMLGSLFGTIIVNSDGREVPVRLIGEQHVMEDLGTIPSFADWARLIEPQAWMMRGQPKLVAIEQDVVA